MHGAKSGRSTCGRCFLAALLAVLACGIECQESCMPERFRQSALRAIESPVGGVFVVEIDFTYQQRRSRVFEHIFTVEEVVKPYRANGGTYWIPLCVNELTSDRKPALHVGKRYVIVTRLKFFPYGWLYLDDALDLACRPHARVLEELRALSKERAAYGSSRLLRYYLQQPLDIGGVSTRYPSGFMDPHAFGFTRDKLREAIGQGMDVLLVRYLRGRGKRMGPADLMFQVVEDFAGREPVGEQRWIHNPNTYSQTLARSKKMVAPYKPPKLIPYCLYIVLVAPCGEGRPVLKARMLAISKNCPTVRKIRSWLKEAAKGPRRRRRL